MTLQKYSSILLNMFYFYSVPTTTPSLLSHKSRASDGWGDEGWYLLLALPWATWFHASCTARQVTLNLPEFSTKWVITIGCYILWQNIWRSLVTHMKASCLWRIQNTTLALGWRRQTIAFWKMWSNGRRGEEGIWKNLRDNTKNKNTCTNMNNVGSVQKFWFSFQSGEKEIEKGFGDP